MGSVRRSIVVLAVVAVAIVAIPAVVVAAGGTFVDDDTSLFEADIEWLAGAGVTRGCNPPTNDHFCPADNVTRGQMAAFMRRFAAFLGAEDGVVNSADYATDATHATNANNAANANYAANAGTLDGYDSSYFTGNDGFSVFHNAEIDVPTDTTTLLDLPNLPAGSYLFIAKTWFYNGGPGEQFAECLLVAGADNDYQVATLADTDFAVPATWTVVHTFTGANNSVVLNCRDYGNAITLNDTKITGIRLDSMTNQPG